MSARAVPRLHTIAADEVLDRRGFVEDGRALLQWGGAGLALHLRAHGRPGGALFGLARRLASAAAESGALLVVNDRLDVALAARLEAVQLGARSLPLAAVRAAVGDHILLGYSAHAADEAVLAATAGADWLLLGTIYETASHPGRAAAGPGLVEKTVGALAAVGRRCPVVAIGGITPERVPEVVAAGAHGVAVLRGIWSAPVPFRAAARFAAALEEASAAGPLAMPGGRRPAAGVAAANARCASGGGMGETVGGADEEAGVKGMSETVRVTVNGSTRELPAGRTVAQALETLGLNPLLVVVEHNRVILERARLEDVEVRAGDNLEIVHFVGGG